MTDMALYCRADGLFEPRADKAIEFVKKNAARMIVAEIAVDTRSDLQNRFLNGWIYKQCCRKLNDAGHSVKGMPWTRDTFHAAMQNCFLVKQEFELNGEQVKVYESTATMSKKRFTEYINDEIRPFMWDAFGIRVEDPDEGYWLEVMREIQR